MNLEIGMKLQNKKNEIGTVKELNDITATIEKEDGKTREYVIRAMHKTWKIVENAEPQVEVEEPAPEVKAEPQPEVKPQAKAQNKKDDQHKAELLDMRKAITSAILAKYEGTAVKETKTKQYDPIINSNGKIIMEVHSAGEFCRIYVVDPLPEFKESELFNRKDGSYAWTINWGYEVPVQNTPDIIEECVRIFGAGLKAIDNKAHMKQVRANKKAIREQRQAEKKAKSNK